MSEQDSGGQMRPDDSIAPPPVLSAGEQLAAARQARGWSIEDVASQLNLAPRQVHAIETGNHAALPGMPITRGFIRAYAKLLKIDATPLLATLGGETAAPVQTDTPRKVVATPFAESRMPSLGERKRSPLPVVAIVAVGVLCAAGYWLLQNRDLLGQVPVAIQSPAAPAQEPSTAPEAAPEDTTTEPVAAPGPETPAASAAADAALPSSSASTVPQEVNQIPAPATPAAQDASAAGSAPVPSAASSSAAAVSSADAMQLSAREQTWVEIRRSNGNTVIFSRLMKAGESQTVTVTEPLTVVIGNAGGIDMTLRGNPVAIKGGSGNVSKITVK